MLKKRNDVSPSDCWNLTPLYPSIIEWEKDFKKSIKNKAPYWPELKEYQGKLKTSPATLCELLELSFSIERKLSKLYTYAHLRYDEDITNDENKTAFNKISTILHAFHQEACWIEPEILSLSDDTLNTFLKAKELENYRFYLEKQLRLKPHTLTPDKEHLLALAGKAMQTPQKAFSAINDADFKFGIVQDGRGSEKELTHGLFGLYMRDSDRTLRKNAFLKMHKTYQGYENTLCELFSGAVESHSFAAKAKNYASCLDAALYPKNIDTSVYHALISTVKEDIGVLHDYIALKKRLPGIDRLHLYDMYVPFVQDVDRKIPYAEAENLVIESVAPLGSEYQDLLQKGLKEKLWVDRFENLNKRSGAYSSGCYDSEPYILMNYKETIREAFILAHEAGHSMHSLLSHKNQPYHYGDYPIFLAEVASTFNETLLSDLMVKQAKTLDEKIFLLTQKIEDIRATLFRQTMFAEFELFAHTSIEQNIPLTPKFLKSKFRSLNEQYFGKDVVIDEEAESEWARIPHFYYNFYVFQYATGISASLALSERVLNGGAREKQDYLAFLKAGSSKYPLDILKLAGVDMNASAPVRSAIRLFGKLVAELSALLDQKDNQLLKSKESKDNLETANISS